MAEQTEEKKEPESKRVHTYPLIRVCVICRHNFLCLLSCVEVDVEKITNTWMKENLVYHVDLKC